MVNNKKMKTLLQIKDEVAREHGYIAWDYLRAVAHCFTIDEMADKAAIRFAKQLIEEDRKDAAEKARVIEVNKDYKGVLKNYQGTIWEVDKSSITDRPLPDLK